VLIRNPREFHRKKALFTAAGPAALQVFSDFERVLTACRSPEDAGCRLLGTAELLETSPALLPAAVAALRQVGAEFESAVEMDDAAFEEYTRRCQAIIAGQAGLHMASVAPATRDLLGSGKMVLREGVIATLAALTRVGVPTFVFSSGYGDVVAQVLAQSGCADPVLPSAVPQNVRVIRSVTLSFSLRRRCSSFLLSPLSS